MPSSELSTSLVPKEPSLLGQSRFWLVQLAGWPLIQLIYFRGPLTMVPEGILSWVITLATSCGLAIACSFGLAAIYVRMPPRWLTGARAIPIVLGLSSLAVLPWSAAMTLLVDHATSIPTVWRKGFGFRFPFFASLLMTGWSGAFLWFLFSDRARTTQARVQEAQARALRAEALAHEAKLLSLRAQLNPHFLFNALTSVVGLTETCPERVSQMVIDIAGLLRRTLDSTNAELATIGNEIDFAVQYLRCESVRFEERLDVQVQVSEQLLPHAIPSMLLQPLVENAIKHGMTGTRQLRLVLHGRVTSGRIVLEVRNSGRLSNGDAAPVTELPSVREGLSEGAGSGLRIVRERLAATYPESGRLEVLEEEGWVVARVRYDPKETSPARPGLGTMQGTTIQGDALCSRL